MKPARTQLRVWRNIQKRGNTIRLPKMKKGDVPYEVKALIIETPGELPFKFKRDNVDLPNRDAVGFLVGVPPEAKRNSKSQPVDENGKVLTAAQYPMPNMSRQDFIRSLFPRGREFDANGFHYTVMQEVPLPVGDVNLYLHYQCDYR